jgi:hypothetical protein
MKNNGHLKKGAGIVISSHHLKQWQSKECILTAIILIIKQPQIFIGDHVIRRVPVI